MPDLDVDVLAGQRPDRVHEVVAVAGEEAAVQGRGGLLRDDVVLVPGVEHRDVGGVLQRSADEAGGRTDPGEQLLGVLVAVTHARDVGEAVEQTTDRGDELPRPLVRVDPRDRLGEVDDRVVARRDRAVTGRPPGPQVEPGDPLLRRLEQVGPAGLPLRVLDGDAVPTDLADRLGDALEDLGVLPDEELAAEHSPGLLVGEEDEEQVPRRDRAGPREVAHAREHHRDHVLHVDRAAAPETAIGLHPGEGGMRPVLGMGGNDVEVTVDAQRAPLAVCSGDADGDGRAPLLRLEDLRVETDLAQLADDVVRRLALPRTVLAGAVVARVDLQQLAADPHDLLLGRGDVSHGCRLVGQPSTKAGVKDSGRYGSAHAATSWATRRASDGRRSR